MSKITSTLSKRVGWARQLALYPKSMKEIKEASDEQLLIWHRFLPSPTSPDEEKFNNYISERIYEKPDRPAD